MAGLLVRRGRRDARRDRRVVPAGAADVGVDGAAAIVAAGTASCKSAADAGAAVSR